MSSQFSSNGSNDSPEITEADRTFVFLMRDMIGPLTVIKGHAQLIGRRSARDGVNEDIVLRARSLAAIELAVPHITTTLAESARLISLRMR